MCPLIRTFDPGRHGMNGTRPTLLVVDDESEVLQSVYDLLRLDYHVIKCERGAEALEILASDQPIHVVMSDQRMPGMSGVEVLKHARRLRPEATRLLFTAYADVKAVIDAVNEGNIFQYIHKPWAADELQAVVRKAVEQHALVTELKETNQRLLDANRLKGAFIEVASHELNTPLMVILGTVDLWKLTMGPNASPEEKKYLERIQKASRRLESTVSRMLKLIESKELDLRLDVQRTNVEELIHEVLEDLDDFIKARRQTVQLEVSPGLGWAEFDPVKVADILVNLIGNAIKFTPDGGTIRIDAHAAGSDEIVFRVADEGVGISPADRKHLFEPFFTGFDTMHHSSGDYQFCKKGIGLGLCLVKTFVALHSGRVDVTTEAGRGTVFEVSLPRHQHSAGCMSAIAV